MEQMTRTAVTSASNVSETETVSEVVISAVASAKDVDPLDLEPLYGVVDPDALDTLFERSTDSSLELQFSMSGCEVLVRGDGEVVVTAPGQMDD